jgi:hypothetical protein
VSALGLAERGALWVAELPPLAEVRPPPEGQLVVEFWLAVARLDPSRAGAALLAVARLHRQAVVLGKGP